MRFYCSFSLVTHLHELLSRPPRTRLAGDSYRVRTLLSQMKAAKAKEDVLNELRSVIHLSIVNLPTISTSCNIHSHSHHHHRTQKAIFTAPFQPTLCIISPSKGNPQTAPDQHHSTSSGQQEVKRKTSPNSTPPTRSQREKTPPQKWYILFPFHSINPSSSCPTIQHRILTAPLKKTQTSKRTQNRIDELAFSTLSFIHCFQEGEKKTQIWVFPFP